MMRTNAKKLTLWGVSLAVATLFAASASAQVVSFATLKPGSIYHTMGTVVAKVITQKTGIRMLVQPLGSGRATMTALNNREAEFAWADVNDAITAVAGTHVYKGRALPGVRLAANIRGVAVGVFAKKSTGFTKVSQMRGKRFPAAYPAFPNGVPLLMGILAGAGMTYDDVVKVPTPSLVPAVNDFIAGKMDVGFFAVGGPKVAEANTAVGGIRFLSVPNTPESVARMRKIRPAYYVSVIKPAGFRAGIIGPTPLMVFDQVLIVGKHVSDKMVYDVLAALVEFKKDLVKGFRPFAGFIPPKMGKTYPGLQNHPSSLKFFKDKGFRVGP